MTVHCTSLSCGTKPQLVRHAQDPPPHPVLCLFGTCAHSQLCVGCQKLIPSRVCYTCVSIKHDVSAVQPLHSQVPVHLCATGGEILLKRKFPIFPERDDAIVLTLFFFCLRTYCLPACHLQAIVHTRFLVKMASDG